MHHFSNRLPWSAAPNSLSRLLADKRNAGAPVADLTETNPTRALAAYPHAEIGKALAKASSFLYQPDPFGLASARGAIAGYYRERGFTVDPSRIALTASTSEAYSILFKLLCDPGDEVLIPAPSYPLFEHLAAFEAVRAMPYQLGYDGSWFLDCAGIEQKISPRTRAVVIVNPNNPTGSFLKEAEREQLSALAARHKLALISDEVFMDYELTSGSGRVKTWVDQDAVLAFSLNGLSKAAAMPQLKLAWMVMSGPLREQAQALEGLELLLDTYLSVNSPVQLALPALLATGARLRAEILDRATENLGTAKHVLAGSPLHVLPVEGGWSVILQLPRTQSEEAWITDLLEDEDLLLQPGFFFDMPGEAFAVASLIVEPHIFSEGIGRLRQVVMDRC